MIRAALLFLIRIYWRTLSPIIGPVCRFQPSCSRYTAVCIERFGPGKGAWLGAKRICRCQPFFPGGYDPPPERAGTRKKMNEGVHPGPSSSTLAPVSDPPVQGEPAARTPPT